GGAWRGCWWGGSIASWPSGLRGAPDPSPAERTFWAYPRGMAKLDPDGLVGPVDTLHRAAWALCGSREDAEDLVQELCARVLAKPRRVSGDELAYLMRTLHNTFLTSRRTASRRPRADVDLELVAAADPRADRRPEEA